MTFYKKGYHVIRNLISEKHAHELHDHLNSREDGNLTCV